MLVALILLRSCVLGCEEAHGARHEATLLATERLAAALTKQGRHDEAESRYRELVHALSEAYGERHERVRAVASVVSSCAYSARPTAEWKLL